MSEEWYDAEGNYNPPNYAYFLNGLEISNERIGNKYGFAGEFNRLRSKIEIGNSENTKKIRDKKALWQYLML